jgi:uncharacterized tellurite resistance protein B-like protein
MGLFSSLDLNESNKRKSHIRNLLAVAISDGTFDRKELELIYQIASNYNMNREEVDAIKNEKELVPFSQPSSKKVKILQVYDLVKLMLADNKIHVNEIKLCRSFAKKLNLVPDIVDGLIALHAENPEMPQKEIIHFLDQYADQNR